MSIDPNDAKVKWHINSGRGVEVLFGILGTTMLIVSTVIIVIICKRREIQPFKKQSAFLMIWSVVGNYLVLANCTVLCIFFQTFKETQLDCYFKNDSHPSYLNYNSTTDGNVDLTIPGN